MTKKTRHTAEKLMNTAYDAMDERPQKCCAAYY